MLMRKFIILLFLFFSAFTVFAENASNIRVRQEGKTIVVTYDLKNNSVVRLLMASDDSPQYRELKAVTGDVGKRVHAGKDRQIVWNLLQEQDEFVAKGVRFRVEATSHYEHYATKTKVKTVFMGQAGYSFAPQLSYGGMIGQMYKGIGWFVSGRSNYQFFEPTEYHCYSDLCIYQDGAYGIPFYSGKSQTTHWAVYGGFMMNFLEWSSKNKFNTFGFYIGGGYGKRELQLELTNGQWVTYGPTSFENGGGNAGLFFSVYGVTLHAGASTIGFEYLEIEAGIGLMF